MTLVLVGVLIVLSSALVLAFSTLTYALRDFSRPKLAEELRLRGRAQWLEPTVERTRDLVLVTALFRLLANLLVAISVLHLLRQTGLGEFSQYALALVIAGTISLFFSVIVPQALSEHDGERGIAMCVGLLHALRRLLWPLMHVMYAIDRQVSRASGTSEKSEAQQLDSEIAQEILSVVEEGASQGVVAPQEQRMIESVITFADMTVAAVMTARTAIVWVAKDATLVQVRDAMEESGHSRLPVIDGSLDRICGMLHARDLVKQLGEPPETFNLQAMLRPAPSVPETRMLRDLLQDFRDQKAQVAIVLDEYGSTAGLVTIEDVLEQLVGEIRDEHEPQEAPLLKRLDGQTFEADASIRLEDFNREVGTSLAEDAGYETLGGYITNTLGRIPTVGASFVSEGLRFTILEAEPQRLKRVSVKVLDRVNDVGAAAPGTPGAVAR